MGLSEGVGGRRALERKIEQQAGWQASSAAAHHLVDLGMAGEPFCAFMMMRAFIHRSLLSNFFILFVRFRTAESSSASDRRHRISFHPHPSVT